MAQCRRFNPEIVSSDAFLEMAPSTQALYFQLGMRADDDGFVSPRSVMRMVGSSEDELKVLIGKRFVLPFETGVIVIKHWRINNRIRLDWYKPTMYTQEKESLYVKENGAYTLDSKQGNKLGTEMIPNRSRSIVQYSIANSSESEIRTVSGDDEDKPKKKETRVKDKEAIFDLFSKSPQPWWYHKQQKEAAIRLFDLKGLKQVAGAMAFYSEHKGEKYLPAIHTPFDLEDKWSKLFAFKERP